MWTIVGTDPTDPSFTFRQGRFWFRWFAELVARSARARLQQVGLGAYVVTVVKE